MQLASPAASAVKMYNLATSSKRCNDVMDIMLATKRTIQDGYTAVMITYTKCQIELVSRLSLHLQMPGLFIAMDEADTFFTQYNMAKGTEREKAMKLFLDMHSSAVCKFISISATPIDIVMWHLINKLRFSAFRLDESVLGASGYTFIKDLCPIALYTADDLKNSSNGWWDVGEVQPRKRGPILIV